MTQIHQPPNANPSLPLSPDLIQKLAATLSKEEMEQVMNAVMEKQNTPVNEKKQVIEGLRAKFPDLEGVKIGRADAAKKYSVAESTIREWQNQEIEPGVPMVESFPSGTTGRGNQTMVNEQHVAAMVELRKMKPNKGGPIKGWYKRPKKEV